jgi:dihydrofolate reductase
MQSLTIIVAATSSKLGIGLKGSLPWRLRGEIRYFKKATTFNPDDLLNVVIMGRKCWESIPLKFRPLPNRHNIVLSRQSRVEGIDPEQSCVEVASSLTDALNRVQGRGFGRIFIIGGAEVYREAMGLKNCDKILLTEVRGDVETDVAFPEFRQSGWSRAQHEKLEELVGDQVPEGEIIEGGLAYEFQLWERE